MTTPLERIPVTTNDGTPSSLGAYAGKVRLVVNVASQCGLTPQYAALETLYRKYRERGLEVLAFPANEFGGQEPGTDAEIKDFCATNYDVSFPIFSKTVVKGEGRHPLFTALTHERPEAESFAGSGFRAKLANYGVTPDSPGGVLWNFEKFLVDRAGQVVARFAPDMPPDAEPITSAIERALDAPMLPTPSSRRRQAAPHRGARRWSARSAGSAPRRKNRNLRRRCRSSPSSLAV